MSVIVKGMEKPANCRSCDFGDDEARFCKAAKEFIPMVGKPWFCPLVELPEIKQYRKSNPDNEKRKTHFQYINSHERVRCGKCGETENLEWHHMIPLSLGGETDDGNMVCLCKECHKKATEYARVFMKREPNGGA